MKVNLKSTNLCGENIPLCPYCDQPIMNDAIIIHNEDYGNMCLAHNQCYEIYEDEEE
ncbi:hypothetical protein [Vibrio harveyi]|uniref:hypothetical protein n=1 Tax=Vibrio harveyi TaxID=669 RepID=UPI003CE8F4D6